MSEGVQTRADATIEVVRLGRVRYADALAMQRALVDERAAGAIPDRLLLVEHEPVITVGRGAGAEIPRVAGIETVLVERGGLATYHGPGQLVAYPIVRLERRDLRAHLRALEGGLIAALARFGLDASRRSGATGVWVRERKIASIGVAVRKWVAFHGVALNVSTDLEGFAGFEPCGFAPGVMTTVERELGRSVDAAAVEDAVAAEVAAALGRRPVARPASSAT
ncbi:MAG TPA: lipoyl(octanoyl) transferase LipB [Planctomycetota bacterium]|nr:lipoyl(octanoyl) transferase LipB [Planctomycetota bacterium]